MESADQHTASLRDLRRINDGMHKAARGGEDSYLEVGVEVEVE
jgi:hypothetical protein